MSDEELDELPTNSTTNEGTGPTSSTRSGARWWNSYEKLSLVELWNKHSEEVNKFDESNPVYREIAIGMNKRGIHVNKQECRRKISTLFNKYTKEKRKQEQTKKDSEWRLFRLIDLIFEYPDLEIIDDEQTIREATAEYENYLAQNGGTEPVYRTSFLMQHHFTMTGVERMRKQNQALLVQRNDAKRELLLKREELRFLKDACRSWESLMNVLEKQYSEHGNARFPEIDLVLRQMQNDPIKSVAHQVNAFLSC